MVDVGELHILGSIWDYDRLHKRFHGTINDKSPQTTSAKVLSDEESARHDQPQWLYTTLV